MKNTYIITISENKYFDTKRLLRKYGKIIYESSILPIVGFESSENIDSIRVLEGVERVSFNQLGKFTKMR
jgi:hypothetical protein